MSSQQTPNPHFSQRANYLYLLVDKVHWGIILAQGNEDKSIMWDLAVNSKKSDTKSSCATFFGFGSARKLHRIRTIPDYNMSRAVAEGKKVYDIPSAYSTPDRMVKATQLVAKDFKYKYTHENCQTFVIDVLKILHAWERNMVPQSAIDSVSHVSYFTVRAASAIQAKTKRSPRALPLGPKFTSSEQDSRPAFQTSFLTKGTMRTQVPRYQYQQQQTTVRRLGLDGSADQAQNPVREQERYLSDPLEEESQQARHARYFVPGAWEE